MCFDLKLDAPENFSVMLQTKETKVYPDLDPLAVATSDAYAVDAAAEKTPFHQDRTRRAEIGRSALRHVQLKLGVILSKM